MTSSRGDIEDVIQSVYKSFFARYIEGQFEIDDWNELWGLLTIITLRKCANRRTYLKARRRDIRREVSTAQLYGPGGFGWDLVDREPSPYEAAALADTVQELFRGFDQIYRETISLILQGYPPRRLRRS
jgi:RNA polymerase sigma-70 factor (ECF subfamily)